MKTSEHRAWTRLDIIIAVIATAMIVYHMISTQYTLVSVLEHQNIHLAFALVLVFLFAVKESKKRWRLLLLTFLVLSLITTGYIHIFQEELLLRLAFPIFSDVIIGTILMLLVLEATRRAFGIVLPALAFILILYTAFGYLLPAPLYTMQYSFGKLISKLSLLNGLYGTILGISANYLFLFVAFGSVLQISGAGKFFVQVGRLLGQRLAGGAALTAVVSSALLGTLTGSVSANVVTSGSYTIPLMKKSGYQPEQAGAIEAAASTGGQIMPPIMGAAAFVMAGITGISYFRIIVVAAIPAILYFFVVGLYAQLQAIKLGIKPLPEKIDVKEMLSTSYLFIIPISILVILLAVGYTPMYVIFWTIISVIVLSLLRKETRPSLTQWAEGFSSGAKLGAQIGVSCAVIGIIVTCITLTGLGLKLPGLVETLSGGSLGIALILTAAVALILGCGMPTVAVYVLVVIVTAPVLLKMGLPLLTAHFFAFFFAVMNFVTLPVAIGAMVASKVAGANFIRTGTESMKAALGGFIIPFLLILVPVLMLELQGPVLEMIIKVISSLVILVAFEIVVVNHYLIPLNIVERITAAISGAMLFAFLITNSYPLTIGFAIFIAITLWQLRRRGASRQLDERH
jgi:TRAP transporter 4TM/12TM fusion protein